MLLQLFLGHWTKKKFFYKKGGQSAVDHQPSVGLRLCRPPFCVIWELIVSLSRRLAQVELFSITCICMRSYALWAKALIWKRADRIHADAVCMPHSCAAVRITCVDMRTQDRQVLSCYPPCGQSSSRPGQPSGPTLGLTSPFVASHVALSSARPAK